MSAHLRIVRGVLTLEALDFGMAGGDIVGKLTMDANRPVIAGTANMQVKELHLERLVPAVKNKNPAWERWKAAPS